ncbi:hypothetical protein JAAARDRAFT_201159 [Jaapia argillacea MUCL 33604]|uniref:Uncharacterized protein n=1 Tax=Jaapia argillacea MUCL 33604 TaxID=933084 RepID=A0A067P2V0_9AGAM|nr:hypothetical protein JAAARDRAFT_201159 [Jaapia argillacea MUCL 33604]
MGPWPFCQLHHLIPTYPNRPKTLCALAPFVSHTTSCSQNKSGCLHVGLTCFFSIIYHPCDTCRTSTTTSFVSTPRKLDFGQPHLPPPSNHHECHKSEVDARFASSVSSQFSTLRLSTSDLDSDILALVFHEVCSTWEGSKLLGEESKEVRAPRIKYQPYNPTLTPIYHATTTRCRLTTSKPFPSPSMNRTPRPAHTPPMNNPGSRTGCLGWFVSTSPPLMDRTTQNAAMAAFCMTISSKLALFPTLLPLLAHLRSPQERSRLALVSTQPLTSRFANKLLPHLRPSNFERGDAATSIAAALITLNYEYIRPPLSSSCAIK